MTLALAAELDDVNERFQAALAALERALGHDAPDFAELGKLRAHLARMAGQRLRFIDRHLCPVLIAGPTAAHHEAARNLRERIGALFSASNGHIGHWDTKRIASDWQGYRASTRAMVGDARALLAMERREIYPLLASARPAQAAA